MSKQIAPNIELQSFSCPHCNANAHQDWYQAFAKKEENNKPHVLHPADYARILSNLEGKENEIPDQILESFRRQSNGEVFLHRLDSSEYAYFKIENLWVSQCYSCKEISFWIHDKMIWPISTTIEMPSSDMPSNIKIHYEEARQIFNHSPKASAALLRLCIELLCDYLNSEGKTLYDKIGSLVDKGLNPKVQKMLDTVRVIGNESVHPGQIDLSDDRGTAASLFKIVDRIVEELITEEKKIKEIYDSLPEGAREGIAARDNKKTD